MHKAVQRENIIPAKKYIFKIIVPDRFKAFDPKKRHARSLSIIHPPREPTGQPPFSSGSLHSIFFSFAFSIFLFYFRQCRVARFVKLVCVNNCPLSSRISIRTPLPLEPSAFRRSGNYFIFSAEPARPLNPSPFCSSLDRTFIFLRFPIGSFYRVAYGHRKIF